MAECANIAMVVITCPFMVSILVTQDRVQSCADRALLAHDCTSFAHALSISIYLFPCQDLG